MPHNPFHGLMQPGRQPSLQFQQLNRAYQSDPRRILGQTLMGQGASSAPVRTPLQGLGRLSSALVGAYLQRKAGDAQAAREDEFRSQITGALGGLDMSETPMLAALGGVDPLAALTAGAGMEASVAQALAQRQPKAPVQMFNRQTRDTQLVVPGSAEQTALANRGYEMGNLPSPDTGFQFDKTGNQVVRPRSGKAFEMATKFITPTSKKVTKFGLAKTAYLSAKSLAADDSGAGDTGLIYAFFTSLDPGGRVTDAEAASTEASLSYGTQLSQKLIRAIKSGRLNNEARAEIVNAMRGVVAQQQKTLQTEVTDNLFQTRLNNLGYKPQDLLPSYSQIFTDLPIFSVGDSNDNGGITPGEQILPADQNNLDPGITNATDAELLRGLM